MSFLYLSLNGMVFMNIQKLANSFISGNYNRFKINKYSQNPISFKGNLVADTVEFSSKSTSEVPNSQLSQLQKEKEELVSKIDSEIAENNLEIEKLIQQKLPLDELESFAFSMIEDKDIRKILENYGFVA